MKRYTGAEYLMIDAATNFGLSKVTFEKRIEWTKQNINDLETLLPQAKDKALYLKAVYAIRDAQAGIATGHLVELDSCSSGIQIMSAAMGCKIGALHTGLVDPDVMPDAYTTCTNLMKMELGYMDDVSRDDAKQAIMTWFYGSEAKPKEIFEEGSPAYQAFFRAAKDLAPEAADLRNILIGIWQPYSLKHSWVMPDGFNVQIKNMISTEVVVKVPELNSSFTHIFKENQGTEKGLSLAANVVHSIDGMIVREMNRRCNYDIKLVQAKLNEIQRQSFVRISESKWDKTKFVSLRDVLNMDDASYYDDVDLTRYETILKAVLTESKPFELICIHDAFKAHPNNMNTVRYWYKEILAEIADSHIMQSIIRQICDNPTLTLNRGSEDLSKLIRESNYALA